MTRGQKIGAGVIGGVLLLGGAYLFVSTRAMPSSPQTEQANAGALVIPSVLEMCQSRGAADGDAFKECEAEENAAGEFVISWMGYNNFIADGSISLDQIAMMASLEDAPPLGDLSADPAFAPDAGGDSIASGDPYAGLASGLDPNASFLQSPAQLALYCLQMAGDWVTMHDCISTNDPSSSISGIQ